jgi:alpha-N-arabinofuranosidase
MKPLIRIALVCLLISQYTLAQSVLTLRADSVKQVIDRNIYGHFAEHLGRCIYDGFYVGEGNTAIPNTNGVRNDVVAALKN